MTRPAPAPREAPARAWTIELPGISPPNLNTLLRMHWRRRSALKSWLAGQVAIACLEAGVPRATGKRRVSITVAVTNLGHAPDHDNVIKVLSDCLRHAGALVDDSAAWVEWGPFAVERGKVRCTRITLEDIP